MWHYEDASAQTIRTRRAQHQGENGLQLQRARCQSLADKFVGVINQFSHVGAWLAKIEGTEEHLPEPQLAKSLRALSPKQMQLVVYQRRKAQKTLAEVLSACGVYRGEVSSWDRLTHDGLGAISSLTMPRETTKAAGTMKKASELLLITTSASCEAIKLKDSTYSAHIKDMQSVLANAIKFLQTFIHTYVPQLTAAQNELKRLKADTDFDDDDADNTKEAIIEFKFIVPDRIVDLLDETKKWPPIAAAN